MPVKLSFNISLRMNELQLSAAFIIKQIIKPLTVSYVIWRVATFTYLFFPGTLSFFVSNLKAV
ncbi:uncharacterized protein RHIMIDRAFT_84801 [Rhizopus microsporus ATCC 52813]|uniref:Uncharacterized protein n=1 Tax=Rhizopus microsporus ATCC 52813 TaxID=1340429 RepID=A0A2G4T2A2_RHIZD|nr:uncharacterized protein RHIMIDRAFT_84801 [Rhizopus microsporus ATCC 52813]PHZ15143.1 hypothetical protein RHIMIDRAFT_84801 [Rhizopus microsporus ATCC 52813]